MPMSMLEYSSDPLEATPEELDNVAELKVLLKEHLVNKAVDDRVRKALRSYINDQQFLIKYVRGRKLNVKKALHSLISYAEVKHVKYPELFPARLPEFVPYSFQCGVVTVLKQRDCLKRTIVLCSASKWDESKVSLEEFICVGRYLADILMSDPGFLKYGVILVIDCKGVSFSHLRQFTLPVIVKFVNLYWQAYPILIKGIYVVNAPIIAKPIYAFCRPFLPAKLKDRLLMTSGVTDLHKRITPEILPTRVGGKLAEGEEQSHAILDYFNNFPE